MKNKRKENLIEKAVRIAAIAHKNQLRKIGNLPYIVHPFMVALKLARYGFSDAVISAALVHDVLEDTNYPEDEIKKELGNKVFKIVKSVTHDNSLPWEEKKKKYIESVKNGSKEAKAVALADKIHNLESLLIDYKKEGSKVWEKFFKGREGRLWFEKNFLEMIKKEYKHPLVKEYKNILKKVKKLR